jgi:hypothetical protein
MEWSNPLAEAQWALPQRNARYLFYLCVIINSTVPAPFFQVDFKTGPRASWDLILIKRTEVIPVKDSHNRIL